MDVIYGSVDNSSSSIIRTIKDVTGTYKMHVYTKDAAGNIVVESKEILLDNRAPEVEFKEFNNVYASYKTQASFETLFSVSDNHVGTVGSVVYSLIDGSGNEYKDIFTTYVDSEFKECILGVDKDCKLIVERLEGEYNVKILAQDTLGNSVEAMSSNKLLVDNYGPRVTRTNPDLHNAIPNYKVEYISEISSVKYCYSTISRDELAECTTEANLVNNEFSIEGLNVDITIYLRIITIDELGNENILDSEIAFDDMPPEIKVDVCVGSDDCAEENKNQYYVEVL